MNDTVQPLIVEIEGGIALCLPPVLNTITTYVALEQEDWFEDEMAFMRRFLKPGMNAIDVGANYGVYGLTMAKAVGPGGRVVCIEPASETLAYLRLAIRHNGLANIDLRPCALSDEQGQRRLKFEASAELHRLAESGGGGGELVEVDTLDRVAAEFADGALDVLKLDAEGEELNILKGGAGTLARQSPLVLFERNHHDKVNTPVIEALRGAGFAMYRVVPALTILVPYEPASQERFQLNLIACRAGRAEGLAQAGLLVETPSPAPAPDPEAWMNSFGRKPFFAPFATQAGRFADDPASQRYRLALNLYAVAMNAEMSPAQRWAALRDSLANLTAALSGAGTAPRLMSLARIAADAGARDLAIRVLRPLPTEAKAYDARMVTEPFLSPAARFDDFDPRPDFAEWCAAAVLEQYDRLRAFSSQYANDRLLPAYDALRASRYFSPPMERRRQLIRMRTGRQNGPQPSPLLATRGPTHRNVAFWMDQETAAKG